MSIILNTLAIAFGSPNEIAIIAVVILVLFGGPRIAALGKSFGEGIRGFRSAVKPDDDAKPEDTRQIE